MDPYTQQRLAADQHSEWLKGAQQQDLAARARRHRQEIPASESRPHRSVRLRVWLRHPIAER